MQAIEAQFRMKKAKISRTKVAAITAGGALATVAIAVAAGGPLAALVSYFGIPYATATLMVVAIGGSVGTALYIWPFLIPVIGTVQAILLFAGAGAVTGW